jgi:hypothetical protein
MKDWGTDQQSQKEQYYLETVNTRKQLQEQADMFTAKVDKLKLRIETDLKKYHRLKAIACYFVAVAFVLLYLRLGAHLASSLSLLLGSWAPLLTFGGPAGAFGLGYLAVYLLF